MAFDIGPRIGIEGEKEFKNALKEINTTLKTLGTEMKAVSSAFDKGDRSVEALASQNRVLNRQIDEQKTKLDLLKSKLAESAREYGENDAKTQKWQQAVNLATADLNKMKRQLESNNKELEEAAKASGNAGDEAEKAGRKAKSSGDDANKGGEGWGKLKDGLLEVGKFAGKAAIGLGTVAAAAAGALAKSVIQSFGELEQNLGGSEAVFGEYAESIQKTGEDAYKNLGVSQSDYLATANKMGVLFQGSGIDQRKSLELTEKAMQRAADMASVMGIDMQVALDSVAGAAKGNFTMMDNLGVAMNATAIEAYAAGKGLDFVWSKATQAEKAEMAMQMFFEKTEQYSGNFAKESTETVTGSIGLLKAALSSFTAGLGNAKADTQKLSKNLADAFKAVVKNIVPVLKNLVSALPAAFDAILTAFKELLPSLLVVIEDLLKQVLTTVVSMLPEMIAAARQIVSALGQGIMDNLPAIISAAIQVISTLVSGLTGALPQIVEAAFLIISALSTGIVEMLPDLVPAVVETMITIAETLIENIGMLVDAAIEIIMALTQGLIDNLPILIQKAPEIVSKLMSAIIENTPKLLAAAGQIIITLVQGIIENLSSLGETAAEIVCTVVSGIAALASDLWEAGKDVVRGIWDGIKSMGEWLWDQVKGFFSGLTDRIKKFFGIKSPSALFRDEIGANLADGIGVGFAREMKNVAKQMNESIPTSFDTTIRTTKAVEGAVNGMAALIGGQGGTFIIQCVLKDGRVLAETVFDPLREISRQRGVALS